VEIPEDVVFTVENSGRAAQMAVYQLLGIDREIPPRAPLDRSFPIQCETQINAFKG
jgi:oleate hydratase